MRIVHRCVLSSARGHIRPEDDGAMPTTTSHHDEPGTAADSSNTSPSLNTLVLSTEALQHLSVRYNECADRMQGLAELISSNVSRCEFSASLPGSALHDALRSTCLSWSEECDAEGNSIRGLAETAIEIAKMVHSGDSATASDISSVAGNGR